MICHYPDKFDKYKHCDCGDVCNISNLSRDCMFKGLCEFMDGSLS